MSFFSEANRVRAKEIVARYPRPKSAILPLAHLAQDQDGWLSPEAMADIAAPTLLVHGTHDIYFGSAHAVTLQRASRGTAELWIEPGMGHGETATSPSLVGRIAAWCVEQIDPGSPTRVGQPAASGGQPVGTSSTVPQPAR